MPLTFCRYSDSEYEYRHVQLPKAMLKVIPSDYHDKSKGTLKLLWEDEWRAMGITQVREKKLQPPLLCSPHALLSSLDNGTEGRETILPFCLVFFYGYVSALPPSGFY